MVRNTSGNGPGLPIQVINLPGGRPCVVVPLQDFVMLLSLARQGAKREERSDDISRFASLIAERPNSLAQAKAQGKLRRFLRDDVAMTNMNRFIAACLADTHHAALSATRGAVEPIGPLCDSDESGEDAADQAAYEEAKARDEEAFPLEMAERLVAGAHPIKVFREYRGMTQAALADQVGLSAMYLSQIETGRRGGSTKALRRIAAALDIDLADLIE